MFRAQSWGPKSLARFLGDMDQIPPAVWIAEGLCPGELWQGFSPPCAGFFLLCTSSRGRWPVIAAQSRHGARKCWPVALYADTVTDAYREEGPP